MILVAVLVAVIALAGDFPSFARAQAAPAAVSFPGGRRRR